MKFSESEIYAKIASVPNWYHKIEVGHGIVTPGINDGSVNLSLLKIPHDCREMRVLDIGTRDGYFAFELEKRGAEVTAVDYVPKEKTGFSVVAELFNSNVTYINENIYNLTPNLYGKYDIVLFLGLLYHLPDMLRALNIVRSLCRGVMYLETQCIDNSILIDDGRFLSLAEISPMLLNIPLVQFYPGRSLKNDPTNYWAPNLKALSGMLSECCFSVVSKELNGDRALIKCQITDNEELAYFNAIASS